MANTVVKLQTTLNLL